MGIGELMRAAGLHPGQQNVVNRMLRDLVREGAVLKDGKRFLHQRPTQPHDRKSGPFNDPKGASSEAPQQRAASPARAPGQREAFRGRDRDAPAAPAKGELVEGTLSQHRDGYGFVDDIFLPPPEAQKALDGDRVQVLKIPSPKGFEGRLVKVLSRRREQSVGTYHEEGKRAWVEPQDDSVPRIQVPPTQLARPGDVVKVRLGVGSGTDGRLGREGLSGEVSGSLGRPGDPSQEVLSVVFSKGFSDEFPDAVMDEADAFPEEVTLEATQDPERIDLRQLPLMTIDGADARDFDDAVYADDLPGGGWRLWVAIADVAHYVQPHSQLDDEAQRRGTSVYLPDRVLPMLPERLSNGLCSLKPEVDRLCMVAEMEIDAKGQTHGTRLYPAVMRSFARCTYEEVQGVLNGEQIPNRVQFKPAFERLAALAKVLNGMRSQRGALDFDLPENKVKVGADGYPERIERRERLESHRLIEGCMLAANEAVARYFHERSVPTVYRFHAEPDPDKLATFMGLAQAYGFQVANPEKISSAALNTFMRTLQGHPEQRALNQLLLRSMMQATYSAENVGHYGLGAEHYLHFTSPIRRYPDLLVHRLLKALWASAGAELTESAREAETERLERLSTHASEQERAAVQAEREMVSFYSALLVKDRVGEELPGTVSSVTDFGFFVELTDVNVEGLVKSAAMGSGAKLDVQRHALVFPSGRSIRVGQKLTVRIAAVSIERRQIDLEVVAFDGEAPEPQRPRVPEARRPGQQHRSGQRQKPSRFEKPPVPVQRPAALQEKRPAPRDPPAGDATSSHPGFDRIRRMAQQTGQAQARSGGGTGRQAFRGRGGGGEGSQGRGESGRGGQGQPGGKPGQGKPKSGSKANVFRRKR